MVLHKFPFIQQRRIFTNLFGYFAMSIQEPIEIRQVLAVGVAIVSGRITITQVRIAVVAIFLAHERVRILPQLVANSRMILQISL